jgi:general secretion pathway protein E
MRPLLPYAFAQRHQLLLTEDGAECVLWHTPESPRSAWSELMRQHAGLALRLQACSPEELQQALQRAYAGQGDAQHAAHVVSEVEAQADLSHILQTLPSATDLLAASDDAPIIRMLNALLMQATREGASDIHIEPYEHHSSVRFRIDGSLREIVRPHRALHAALISRLKIMAELDIAEKRLPQDGRIRLRLGQQAVDVRVSTLPGAHGERAVLRLLDKRQQGIDLGQIGMTAALRERLQRLVAQPHGLLLVTGPTGSGKTTTLYALLQRLDTQARNILTVEDPIEYELPGIGQTQVHARIGMDFARALRAILRQDPDVIMIGEIRDQETAQIALQAAMTGHLVLATLHTNDAVSAVTRLTDMGVEPYLISASVLGVLAQRLLRKTCVACAGRGCAACGHTGYQGRTGIYELMVSDDALRAAIHHGAPETELRALALQGGMTLLRDDGQRLVDAGISTAEELWRVTRD